MMSHSQLKQNDAGIVLSRVPCLGAGECPYSE